MLSARNPHECPEPAETVWNFPSGAPVCPKVLLPQQVIVLSARTRVLFLLSRIPTRRPRRVRLCVHSSHACSNPWSLRKTVKMCAGSGPSASDLPQNWPCVLWVPCLGLVDVGGLLLGLASCGRSGTSDVTS